MNIVLRIKSLMGGRMLRDIRGTMLIALAGRLCHFVAFVYAARCLGEGLGESTEALGWAQYLQFIFTLGLDIVAVRHLAGRSISFEKLVSGIFTARIVIYGGLSFFWILGLVVLDVDWNVFQLWLAAALNLFALGMNFQWVFQAKQRMPAFTLIQSGISIIILLSFFSFFKMGDSPSLQQGEIQQASAWVLRLKDKKSSVDVWISDHLSSETKSILLKSNAKDQKSEEVVHAILQDLNQWMVQEPVFEKNAFKDVSLRQKTVSLLESDPKGYQLLKCNRFLLEDAYPDFIPQIKPGTRMGADLWVMGISQFLVTCLAWRYIRNRYRVHLISRKWFSEIIGFIKEGLPNWIFGLLYNTLITVGMLSLRKLSAGNGVFENDDDAYGSLYRLALAAHFILAYVGSVIYTRIVVWKNERDDFFFRVILVCFGVLIGGVVACSIIHLVHPWLFPFLFKRDVLLPAAPYMSWMLFGRFMGLASGILVWGMLAHHKDWNAVKCAVFPVLASVALHFWLVPLYGMKASVFLNCGGELALFMCCLLGFLWMRKKTVFNTQ